MGQGFYLINLDTLEHMSWVGKLLEGIWDDYPDLIGPLCLPPRFPPSPQKQKGHETIAIRVGRPTINDLPPELVAAIFEHLDDYTDCLCFAFTCSFVWSCGIHILEKQYLEHHARQRGARIICLGDRADNLPPALNNAKTLARYVTMLAELEDDGDSDPAETDRMLKCFSDQLAIERQRRLRSGDPTDIIAAANVHYSDLESDTDRTQWNKGLEKLLHRIIFLEREPLMPSYRAIDDAVRELTPRYVPSSSTEDHLAARMKQWHSGITVNCRSPMFRPAATLSTFDYWPYSSSEIELEEVVAVMVLRNLTKQQFIRSDTFTVNGLNGRDRTWGFGKALVVRTCWSTDAGPWKENMHHGVWAGDAFDVVPLRGFFTGEGDISPDGWTDVTQEVREEMIGIWKAIAREEWEDLAW